MAQMAMVPELVQVTELEIMLVMVQVDPPAATC